MSDFQEDQTQTISLTVNNETTLMQLKKKKAKILLQLVQEMSQKYWKETDRRIEHGQILGCLLSCPP